ncbi:MAG: zinc-dependent alcohol dehydrogenase [Microbacterium sp.]
MKEIRRILVEGIDEVSVETVPAPEPAAGQVLVRSTVVGICGSDVHAAHGRHPFIDLPFRPGHEIVGVVAGAGEGVDPDVVGKRVVIEPNLACGECEPCREGRYNICATLDVFGCQTPGGLADEFVIGADRVIELPDDLDDTWASLIEPLATPVHAVRRAGDLAGRRVVVFGAGPIGLFLAIAAKDAGAEAVVVADLVASKRERAERLGATGTFDPTSPTAAADARAALGGDAHVVFDGVSRESTVALGIDLLYKGGRLMTVGVPAGGTLVPLDLIQDHEIELIGNLMYVREDVDHAIALLRRKTFAIDELVTATFPLAQTGDAFRASDDPEQVKVLVTVP